jgi:hypothetical protein
MALGIAPEHRRCLQQKQSSKNDETVENGRVRRIPVLVCTSRLDEHEKALRQTTLFSMVSSNWGDSLGREHLTSDV